MSVVDGVPEAIIRQIANRVKTQRLARNLIQKALALRSDVSLASYRRFERTGEIAFRSLVMIGIVLDMSEDFNNLFVSKSYQRIEELVLQKSSGERRRGTLNKIDITQISMNGISIGRVAITSDGWGSLLLDRCLRKRGVDVNRLTILERLSLLIQIM